MGYANQYNTAPLPRDELHRLYVVEGLSCKDIAVLLGCSPPTVHRWLQRHGIGARNRSEARRVAKKPTFSEETLERMRARAAVARTLLTPESHRKQAEKMKGREAWNKGKPMSEETKAKLRAAWNRPGYREMKSQERRDEKSPHWKGGIKPELSARLDRWEWRQTRKLVYERDNWTCQDCGRKCKNSADSKNDGRAKIQAHHIVARRDGGTDELGNLTTLCMSCHHKREAEKKPRTPTGRPRFAARA